MSNIICSHKKKRTHWNYNRGFFFNEILDQVQTTRTREVYCENCGKVLEILYVQPISTTQISKEYKKDYYENNKEKISENGLPIGCFETMVNEFIFVLDGKFKYNLRKLEEKLSKFLNMSLTQKLNNQNILFYSDCTVILEEDSETTRLIVKTNYFNQDENGKYLNKGNSELLRQIEIWTKDTYNHNNIKKKTSN